MGFDLYKKIQLRQGTATDWQTHNPTLSLGEPGYATDTKKLKVGDGVTPWNTLPWFNSSGFNVIDNLTSASTTDALSAAQGKVLNDAIAVNKATIADYATKYPPKTIHIGDYNVAAMSPPPEPGTYFRTIKDGVDSIPYMYPNNVTFVLAAGTHLVDSTIVIQNMPSIAFQCTTTNSQGCIIKQNPVAPGSGFTNGLFTLINSLCMFHTLGFNVSTNGVCIKALGGNLSTYLCTFTSTAPKTDTHAMAALSVQNGDVLSYDNAFIDFNTAIYNGLGFAKYSRTFATRCNYVVHNDASIGLNMGTMYYPGLVSTYRLTRGGQAMGVTGSGE